ncbi:hypothetical protein BBJ28_00020809, partial [Nothophytophthora sp. Chile5]
VPDVGRGAQTSAKYVEDRWRALSECFEVLQFRQKGVSRVEHKCQEDICTIHSTAEYILRITPHTIQSVFPHLAFCLSLLDVLVGKVIKVPSQLTFEVESDTGLMSRIVERMDFVAAMAEILPDRQELSFVMSDALLALDGVACYRDVTPPIGATAGHHTHLETSQSSAPGRALIPIRTAARRGVRNDTTATAAAPRATQGETKKAKKNKEPRKPRGWGPFQSVLKERSVDFNLTLDVQNLQQEVQNMTTLRDILRTKSLVQRDSPEGSLMLKVREYFQIFRAGAVIKESGRKRLMDEQDQRAFMHSIMDKEVDVNGLHGPDVMMDQMIAYATFVRLISMTVDKYGIIVTEDSVVITTKATARLQILRNTIETVFPHIIGDEWLVAQLVGREITAPGASAFYFNAAGKCCKYDVHVDFVEAFLGVVKDPRIVDRLLGRALITSNAMLGVATESPETSADHPTYDQRFQLEEKADVPQDLPRADGNSPALIHAPSGQIHRQAQESMLRIVEDYYLAFANGYQTASDDSVASGLEVSQHDFLTLRFARGMDSTSQSPSRYVEERWRTLSQCFEVLGFQEKIAIPIEYESHGEMCMIRSSAEYFLRITFETIQSVFPHLISHIPLLDALVEKVITVPSQLTFAIERDTGRIYRIGESMDFMTPIAELLPDRQDLPVVMSQARLTRDGVAYHEDLDALAVAAASVHSQVAGEAAEPSRRTTANKSTTGAHVMSMADILG